MDVKIKTIRNRFPQLQATLKLMNGRNVSVGAIGKNGEMAWLAGIHEYGLHIKVTDKMRAYLHRQGLHLKKSTTEIIIPERSFLRTGFDECEDQVLQTIDLTLGHCLGGQISQEEFFRNIGLLLMSGVKDRIQSMQNPSNHPFTVAQKGSSAPLRDTGNLIGAINYEVE